MLSAISISRFAWVEPRKTFTAVGTALFRFVCINPRRFNSKVRHHSLLNANPKGNANIEAKVVPRATSKQMYRATPNVLSSTFLEFFSQEECKSHNVRAHIHTRFFRIGAHISLQSMTHPRHHTFARKPRDDDEHPKEKGYLAMGGQIIDATIVSAPKQHNSREENETVKEGKTPEDWKSKLAKNRQKDKDARPWVQSSSRRRNL
jgi:hypothetical protein